jgi:hypothetical protein
MKLKEGCSYRDHFALSTGLLGAFLVPGLLLLGSAQPAKASLFVSLSAGGTTLSCDNSTLANVGACSSGFSTSVNSNLITFSGNIGGYSITSYGLTTNNPGTSTLGDVLDSAFNAVNNTASGALTIDFSTYNMTAPAGPTLYLSASQQAGWTISTAGDNQTFTGWGRPDNTPTIPGGGTGGGSVALSPCTSSGAPSAYSCSNSANGGSFTKTGADYALTGQETITEAKGSQGTFGAQVDAVGPEPASFLIVGIGLVALGCFKRKK